LTVGAEKTMSTIRALVADDHAIVRAGIVAALRDMPDFAIVGEVADGPGLFTALSNAPPDLLLVDIVMPDFEPISAIRLFRELYPGLKILVVSAYDDDLYVEGLFRAGVHGYHLKDQPLSELRLAVQQVLAGGRWVCSPLVEKLVRIRPTTLPVDPALTRRQREFLRYLQQALDNVTIARKTGLSTKTVENHLTRLYRQLGVQSRLEAVNYAAQHPGVLGQAEPGLAADNGETVTSAQPRVTIILVDDHPRYRAQLRSMIGKACPWAQIREAENTQAALQAIEKVAPQLAFVDMVLGDESGIDCIRCLKQHSSSTQFVLLSAYPDKAFHRLAVEAGAVAFVDKSDLDAAGLRELIEDVTR
jgi:DNA-binding NarL/FixJ family response regulator